MSLSTTIRGSIGPNPGPDRLDDQTLLAQCRYRPWEAWLDRYGQRLSACLALLFCLGLSLAVMLGKSISPAWGLLSFAGVVICLLLTSLVYFVAIWLGLSLWFHGLVIARSRAAVSEFHYRIGAGGIGRYCREARALFDTPDPPDWILLRQRRPHRFDLCYWERIQLRCRTDGVEGLIESRLLPAGEKLGDGYPGETLDDRKAELRSLLFPGLPVGYAVRPLEPSLCQELLASLSTEAPELQSGHSGGGQYRFAVLRREPRKQYLYSSGGGGCCRRPDRQHAHGTEAMRRLEARLDELIGGSPYRSPADEDEADELHEAEA